MPVPRRGEVWWVDLGLAAKVRPCLLLTDYPAGDDLMLVTVIPHTTALRGLVFGSWQFRSPFSNTGRFTYSRCNRCLLSGWSSVLAH